MGKIENVIEDPMPGIEVQISLEDIWNGLKQCEDILDNGEDIMAVTFKLEIEGPGTGHLPDECTSDMKAIEGKLAFILNISEYDDIEIVRVFLNGIRRNMEIVPETIWSKLVITDKPWRNRRFSVKNRISNDYFEEDSETEIEKDDNENDTDERKGETSTNDGAGRKRCLIYKKDMETHRIEIPFKDSIVEKNEEDNETTHDPKNGGKKEVNQNKKDALGGVSIYNRIYKGIESFSKAAISGFLSLKENAIVVSENVKKMIRDNKSQNEVIEVKEKVELVDKNEEAKNESIQCHKKNDVKLKNTIKFEPISLPGLILMAILFGSVEAGMINNRNSNEIEKEDSTWKNSKDSMKSYEDLVIKAYDCLQENQPGTTLSLRAPERCQLQDGSAYYPSKLTNAQVLEKLTLVPVNITLCKVHFYVSVGWCGGEYALENFKHGDVQTLRSQILVSERDCNRAETDGFLKISTPEYGSIGELDNKLNLEGGRSQALFQPVGVSRPNSWCKGEVFYPPPSSP